MSEQNPDTGGVNSEDAYQPGAKAEGAVDSDVGADAMSAPVDMTQRDDPERILQEQREKYLRLAAEYENFRKRAVRERQEAGWRAQADMVRGLVDALDDLARFAHIDPSTVDSSTVVQGVDMVERKVLKSLSGHGLEIVNPVDHAFDPALHEAVATEPALSSEDDHLVARVYQPGYVFNGQLLRPARVVVKQWNG